MRGLNPIARVLGIVLMIASMSVALTSGALAQSAGTPVVQSNDTVTVNCAYDSGADESACTYTLNDADGSNPDSFTILSSQLCASPVKIGTSNWDNAGNLSQAVAGAGGSNAVTLTFPGKITASSGGSSYGIVINGDSGTITGDSISCEAAGSNAGNGSSSGSPSDPVQDTITIHFYDCTTDPGSTEPSSDPDCSPASNVSIGVTADGADGGTYASDGSGTATFTAPDGSAVVVTEDQSTITSGYVPYGNGIVSFTAADGFSRTFVHLPETLMGRVQIASGTCPTSGDSKTTFRVVEPNVARVAATVSCASTPNVSYTLLGGPLGDGLPITTDSQGNWRGFLIAGDYQIKAADGTTSDFTVYAQDIVVIVGIDYVAQPTGAVDIARWQCSDDPNADTTIDVADTAPSDPSGCTPSSGKVSISEDGSSASPLEIDLGSAGAANVDLKPASYVITDETSGKTASFDVTAGGTVYITIKGGPASGGNDGNSSSNSGNSSGNSSNGNSSGNGDGTNGGSGNGSGNGGGNGSGNGVTSLPDTGVFQTRPSDALPLLGAALMLASILVGAAWTSRRRSVIGR